MGAENSTGREMPYEKTQATLYYFAGRGRADQIRWMLAYNDISFAFRVIASRERFLRLKEYQLPFGQIPLLQIDGIELVQTQAILRYLAKKCSMAGSTKKEEVRCDMIAESISELIGMIGRLPFLRQKGDTEEENAHKELCRRVFKERARVYETCVARNKGPNPSKPIPSPYIVGDKVSYVDILVVHAVTWFVEELGEDIMEGLPRLVDLQHIVLEKESLRTFLGSRQYFPIGDDRYCTQVNTVLGRPNPIKKVEEKK